MLQRSTALQRSQGCCPPFDTIMALLSLEARESDHDCTMISSEKITISLAIIHWMLLTPLTDLLRLS